MGNCWGARIKDGSTHPGTSGMFSRGSGKDGSRLSACSSRVSSASMPPSAKTESEILQSANVKVFSYNDLRSATRNFRPDSVIGGGGFGSVYKGWIDEHTLSACKPGTGIPVAVKRLNQEGLQGHREWLAEVNFRGQICHSSLVKLIGYCLEDEYRLLVYEFMPRGSLQDDLFRRGSQPLSWKLRVKVALGAAKGLAFLHEEAKVIYRDFRISKILLDVDYTAKLSYSGLAKDGLVGIWHVNTSVYEAPEYVLTGHLTAKCDIYSFGVVLLEMLSGRRAFDMNRPLGEHNLVQWAGPYLTVTDKRKLYYVVDGRLRDQYPLGEAQRMAALIVKCLSRAAKERPSIDTVVSVLQGIQDSSEATRKPRLSDKPSRKGSDDLQKEAVRDQMPLVHS